MRASWFPVIGPLLRDGTDPGLEDVKRVAARTDRLHPVRPAVRDDEEVVIGQKIRQIHVAARHRDADLVRAERLHLRDVAERRLGGRFRVAAVQVQRIDNIVRVQRLAVRESNALADIEDPIGSARLRFPVFEQFRRGPVVLVDLDEAVHDLIGEVDRHPIGDRPRIEAVRGGAARHAELEGAARCRRRLRGPGLA